MLRYTRIEADKQRTTAATPQIQSLNPLVSITAFPTLSPFIRNSQGAENGAQVDQGKEIEEFLKREKVDVVVGCDLSRGDIVRVTHLSSFPFPPLPFLTLSFPHFPVAIMTGLLPFSVKSHWRGMGLHLSIGDITSIRYKWS
jgi:hypothetical protein